jgi:hypothetical protein
VKKPFLLLGIIFFFTSCFPQVKATKSGGIRLVHKKDFEYSKIKYNNGQRIKVTTEALFEQIAKIRNGDTVRQDGGPYWKFFYRFFPDGQMLLFRVEPLRDEVIETQMNDQDAGTSGYFAVSGNRLKFEVWVPIFGDRTPRTYGLILNDSTLKIYETYVPDCYGSFDCLEKKNNFSIWKRRKSEGLKSYIPNW